MKTVWNTLLGRTAIYLVAIILIVQALWYATAGYLIETQVKPAFERPIIDMVAMAQALILSQPSDTPNASTHLLKLPHFGVIEIIPDSVDRPELVPHEPDDLPGDLSQSLQERLGPLALSLREKNSATSWLRFPANDELYWLKFPLSPTETVSNAKAWFLWLKIALAVGGAYLIVFQLTRKLRYLTEAARKIGHGEPPEILDVSGPEEVRALCEGFNQMSRDLMKLEADRRLMLAGISHDLRTPLTRLRIAMELDGSHTDPAMIQDIDDIDAILGQFLDYARDGSEETPEVNDLNALVEDCTQRFATRGHLVEVNLGQLEPFIFRKHSIRRAIDNLIDNAIRYGESPVRVQTRRNSDNVQIIVSDGGPGIQSTIPTELTKPFAREDVSRTERGAGLGLTIVERVVRLHGGRLLLENARAGGLSVTIEIPY
ncbi:ATP-binding protein [Cerasicoccus frondis]|uniref:ATP-binding protein n=1 Tax=Cerasicoccus frondis TaxID=490090 RepID=UPI00285254E5|nr:ATP-binding protein [Cerasicoccus frondis]